MRVVAVIVAIMWLSLIPIGAWFLFDEWRQHQYGQYDENERKVG